MRDHGCEDMSVREFAEMTKTNPMQMGKYLSGFAVPTLPVALRLSRALGITVEELTEGADV